MRELQVLLRSVPDTPVWVETRGMLLRGARVCGSPEACVIVGKNGRLLSVLGTPERSVVDEALGMAQPGAELLAAPEVAEHTARLLGTPGLPATIHATEDGRLSREGAAGGKVRLLRISDSLEHVPAELRRELEEAMDEVPVAAAFHQRRPVAFCYPGAVTETLWDVSVDTLAPHRRKGLATRAFLRMFDHLRAQGLLPVWGAFHNNRASLLLARKLGLRAVGSLLVFDVSPPSSRRAE